MPGNHLVIPYPNKDSPEFYLKVYPEYPLVEFFLNDLTRRLGYYPPRDVDLWLWQCGHYDYPVLISQAVKGKSLQKVWEENSVFELNPQAFSQSVLISSLTNLEDNKPDNLIMVVEQGQGRLCLIDADRWFVPSFKLNQLHAKDCIFCLDAMLSPVDRVLQEEILCLNLQALLNAWVAEMNNWGKRCIQVFGRKVSDYYSGWRADEEKSLLLPPLKFQAINELFDHLQLLQEAFKKSLEMNKVLTHWDMLAAVNHVWQTITKAPQKKM